VFFRPVYLLRVDDTSMDRTAESEYV